MDIINTIKAQFNTKTIVKREIEIYLKELDHEAGLYKPNSPFQKRCKYQIGALKELAERLGIELEE